MSNTVFMIGISFVAQLISKESIDAARALLISIGIMIDGISFLADITWRKR